jgi:lysophospholipase L1-like esterase
MNLILSIFLTIFCINGYSAVAVDGAEMQTSFIECDNMNCSSYVSKKFSMDESFLTGSIVRGETFFAKKGFKDQEYKTAFIPKKILAVYSPSSGYIFQPGVDYIATPAGIKVLDGSSIITAPEEFTTTATINELKNYGVRVTVEVQKYQYAISYEKQEKFFSKSIGSLGGLKSKIGKHPISITFFGDSITEGANATSTYSAPHQPGYVGLVMAELNNLYPRMWVYRNNSVGGWSSINASASVQYRVNDLDSDLVVLAFGMNGGDTPADYRKNLKYVIDEIQLKNPATSILIVSPTRANPYSHIKNQYVDQYLSELTHLSSLYKNVAVADVTSTWDKVLINKSYYDLTGNGLNHPNDFGHRIIAEVVLNTILGSYFQR